MANKRDGPAKRDRDEGARPGASASPKVPEGATRTRALRLQIGLAVLGVAVAAGALGTLLFLGAPGGTGPAGASSPGPKTTPAPWTPPTPPPGFVSHGLHASPTPHGRPSPGAPESPPPPSALEGRFPRTPEGTAALAAAYANEHDARARIELLHEVALRVGASPRPDPRGPVAMPAGELEAFFARALDDPDPLVRLETIGVISNRDFAPAGALLEAFVARSSDREARRVAFGGLAEAEGERAVPLLADLAGQGEAADRLAALEALGHVGTPAAAAALDAIAGSDAPDEVRARAKGLATRVRATPPR